MTLDGCLSVPKITSQHPLLKELFDEPEGLEWYVWKAHVEVEYPLLPDVFQAGLNAKYSVQQGMDMWQVFLRACALWSNGSFSDKTDQGASIVKDIWRANPKCSLVEVEAFVEISRKFGGSDPSLVQPLGAFMSTFKVPGRSVHTGTLQAMASLKMSADKCCPHIIMTTLMILASAPTSNVITSADVRSLSSEKPAQIKSIELVESIIAKTVALVDYMQVPPKVSVRIVSELRSSLVMKLFGKIKKLANVDYNTIAYEMIEQLKEKCSHTVENPFMCGKGKGKIGSSGSKGSTEAMIPPAASPQGAIKFEDGKAVGVHLQIVSNKGFAENILINKKKKKDSVGECIPNAILLQCVCVCVRVCAHWCMCGWLNCAWPRTHRRRARHCMKT